MEIRAIGYDREGELLWVQYRGRPGGHLYRNVPRHVFDDMMQASPIDAYANYVLRNYHCEYRAAPPEAADLRSC